MIRGRNFSRPQWQSRCSSGQCSPWAGGCCPRIPCRQQNNREV